LEMMKTFDLIVIGTGSAAGILDAVIADDPEIKIALIDKDEPGGICLTRGCIPSKMLLYPPNSYGSWNALPAWGSKPESRGSISPG
jgi:mycothione reductase